MVSTRRRQIPSSPPNVGAARAVPDDPPPPPPTCKPVDSQRPCTVSDGNLLQSTEGGSSAASIPEQAPPGKGTPTVVRAADELHRMRDCPESGATMLKPKRDAQQKMAQTGLACKKKISAGEESVSHINDAADDRDSDAPDEEPSSLAMSSARAQMEQERLARAAVVKGRRARRRARVAANGETNQPEVNKSHAENLQTEMPSLLLPDDVIGAVEGAVDDQRKSRVIRHRENILKKQKRKLVRRKELKVFGGIHVAVASSKRKEGFTGSKGRRESAAAFLQASMRNPGLNRVSAAEAARIASKSRISE